MDYRYRLVPFQASIVLSLLCLLLSFVSIWFFLLFLLFGAAVLLGVYDQKQKKRSLPRNYPIWGRMRYFIEGLGPALRQYIVESNKEGKPFDRDFRSLVYQRAKNIEAKKAFGTELDVYSPTHVWVGHSIAPRPVAEDLPRVEIGGPDCGRPYSASIFNISAMSFGSLSANAILALNKGARKGNFYHTTGEGAISRYHRQPGGNLVWQIGSGYFGCRAADGSFDPGLFAETAADDQVKMIEIKLSQGAKPGHGGILPAAKITAEIAETRKIPMGIDCVSPAYHSAFSTPLELIEFIARLRELSGGKPVGFKFCLGHPWEFLAICKAMLEVGTGPDFIVVDGAEGGTGAAPLEFSDRLGFPLREGQTFVHNALVGCNLRDRIKIGASGKIATAGSIGAALAFGADYTNAARSFMFCLGCIQAQECHTNHCPVGVATQNRELQKALDPDIKADRVCNYHRNSLRVLNEIIAAVGLDHPRELQPSHIFQRTGTVGIKTYAELYTRLEKGELLEGTEHPVYARYWLMAQAESFKPAY
ncbi:FMN-binding glutamate synthase family protein [Geothermobacter hydrogeniphilus]|uniref:FMN-binding glutamate synthase family protein n=1 Tax=Geothermobacter hydrogeniphilus TaxID=1969733 RepID=A0A1X0Y6A1_9BACT|nr:FMN-binding glutamate synthase family protein [Geothermobacter hydrogeniphilus]ORJ60637.1 FMN-binding glutamate synthase family protein [Geothermobacter hydrogeniphilus]